MPATLHGRPVIPSADSPANRIAPDAPLYLHELEPAPHASGRFEAGDLAERESVWHQLQPLVRRLVRKYATSLDQREDLSSEIYVRFCAFYAEYDASRGIPLRAYLIRMLSQATFNHMRGHWKQQVREVSLTPNWNEGQEAQCVGEDPTPSWDQALWLESAVEALPRAIKWLPKRQQQVVIWRYFEGRSFEEIAADLEVRPATVRSLLRHAVNSLRTHMQRLGAG